MLLYDSFDYHAREHPDFVDALPRNPSRKLCAPGPRNETLILLFRDRSPRAGSRRSVPSRIATQPMWSWVCERSR